MAAAAAAGDFQWPWQYAFPPFFTIQPNEDTRRKQLEAWCDLVCAYARHHRLFRLTLHEALGSPLFHNAAIDRKLPPDFARTILEELARRGRVQWLDKDHVACLLLWRTPQEWAAAIWSWVEETGHRGGVCTLYELSLGETAVGTAFEGIDEDVLVLALQYMQSQGKASLFAVDDSRGVKFS